MYLVRCVQRSERVAFIDRLGKNPKVTVPLPFMPRRSFGNVAIIHGVRVLGFKLARVEEVDRDVIVGSSGTAVIKAKSLIHVKQQRARVGKARIPGFQGVRYFGRWSDFGR
jgi:hypothetical protein